jgi:predicted nucleic acid-binding protein
METVVLDASALIAYSRDEAGAITVERMVLDTNVFCLAHAINVTELYYDYLRATDHATAKAVITDLVTNGLTIREDMDTEFWMVMGQLKAKHRISIADCCGLTLAHRLHAEFVTADHHELDSLVDQGICSIRFIR